MTKKQFTSKYLALTAVALATLSLSILPAFAEDAQQPPQAAAPSGEATREGPKDGPRAETFEKRGKEMFEKTDGDKDGFISKTEMEASNRERLDAMFSKSDLDKDGKLSPDELRKGREALRDKFKAKFKDRERNGPRGNAPDGPTED